MRIAREGWPVIGIVCVLVLGLPALVGVFVPWLGAVLGSGGVVIALWSVWFFRDPERLAPPGDDLVISPADGKVITIDRCELPAELRGDHALVGPVPRVVIFMNVFSVHVNRVPCTGTIRKIEYRPGQFCSANLDKASDVNERSGVVMRDKHGRDVAFIQIAGLVARRIINRLAPGQQVSAGERYGLIRFGSRVEVFFPSGADVRVKLGQQVVAGETALGELTRPASVGVSVQHEAASSPVGR